MALDPKELHHDFVVETTELLAMAEGILLNLENSEDIDQIHALFRAFHTIKGTSAFLGFSGLSDASHAVESVLDGFRSRRFAVTRPIIDLLLLYIDAARAFMQLLQLSGADRAQKQDFSRLTEKFRSTYRELDARAHGESAPADAEEPAEPAAMTTAVPVVPAATTTAGTVAPAAVPAAPPADIPVAALPDDLAKLLGEAPAVDVKWSLPWEKNAEPVKLAPKKPQTPTIVGSGTGASSSKPGAPAASPGSGPAAGGRELPTGATPTRSKPNSAAAAAAGGVPPAAAPVGPALEKRELETRITLGPGGLTGAHDVRRETQVIERTFRAQQRGSTKLVPMMRGREHGEGSLAGRTTLRVDARQIDELINLVGELVLCRNRLLEVTSIGAKTPSAKRRRGGRRSTARRSAHTAQIVTASGDPLSQELIETLDKATTAVHKSVMRLRMVSLEPFFQRFPRLVHDLSGQLNKMIRLEIAGETTELDKSVVEAIADPLVHLVRNAAFHGIETPEERVKAHKPRAGTIFLSARPEGESVAILIEDDGRGLDIERIAAKAVRTGLLTAEQIRHMPPHEIIELVFLPGFSTEDEVGAISGRGVGLDVVREYINQIGGSVSLSTEPGNGTRITLNLPMTLAILRALLVQVNGMTFAVPLSAVRKTRRLKPGDARLLHGQWILTDLHAGRDATAAATDDPAGEPQQMIPLTWADQSMGFVRPGSSLRPISDANYAVMIGMGGRMVAWAVDRLIGQEDIVAKSLPEVLGAIPGLAGATIASDGATILIADVSGFTTQVE